MHDYHFVPAVGKLPFETGSLERTRHQGESTERTSQKESQLLICPGWPNSVEVKIHTSWLLKEA